MNTDSKTCILRHWPGMPVSVGGREKPIEGNKANIEVDG